MNHAIKLIYSLPEEEDKEDETPIDVVSEISEKVSKSV